MQLLKIEDPRDPLNKASRYELCQLAKANGIAEITYGSDLQLPDMVKILHERGIHSIKLQDRTLGDPRPYIINADDAQPQQPTQHPTQQPEPKLVSDMNMTEMRKECKRRGIKMARTDNLNTLREKLGG